MSLTDSIARGIADFDLLHAVLTGDASTTVTTEGGNIPSIAKVIAGIYERVLKSVSATSTTVQTFTNGTKTFTVEAGKSFSPGQLVIAANAAGGYLFGNVVSYTGTTLTLTVTQFKQAGTSNAWNLTFSAPAGAAGKDGLDSQIAGPTGKSAYELAQSQGFNGTLAQYLDGLHGRDGKDGASVNIRGELTTSANLPGNAAEGDAYIIDGDIWIKGASGWFNGGKFTGDDGKDGKDNYQLAKDAGFTGTLLQYLASLKGEDGKDAYELAQEEGFSGTRAEWLASLKGEPGQGGGDGKAPKLLIKLPWM